MQRSVQTATHDNGSGGTRIYLMYYQWQLIQIYTACSRIHYSPIACKQLGDCSTSDLGKGALKTVRQCLRIRSSTNFNLFISDKCRSY